MSVLVGTITIGQAPRADLVPMLDSLLPTQVHCLHRGVLDGLSIAEIETRFAPRPDAPVLTSRLLTGEAVTLYKPAVEAVINTLIAELEAAGCRFIYLLCTGEFYHLQAQSAWLLEPDRIVPPLVATLSAHKQIGVLVPLDTQIISEATKWQVLPRPPVYAAATPYQNDTEAVVAAAEDLVRQGADLLVLDCMGYTERHRKAILKTVSQPVLLSNQLVARVLAEMCSGDASREFKE